MILPIALLVARAVGIAALGPCSNAVSHVQQDARAVELAHEVERILEAKCTECHVPESKNAKARRKFDTARDLSRVVEDWVAAGELELSDLWLQIEDGTMPPEEAVNGPLSVGEKEVVRAWILAGAPLAPAPSAGVDDGSAPGGTIAETARATAASRWLVFAGHLHPSLVHFPIGLLLAAGLTELFVLMRSSQRLEATALVLVRMAAFFAPLAALAGWLNALDAAPDQALEFHRWTGVATAVLALVLLPFSERAFSGQRRGKYRLLLFLACTGVGLAGHLGGRLVYGADYLSL